MPIPDLSASLGIQRAAGPRLSHVQASLCVALAVFCYAVIDTITKGLTVQYGVAQILLLRGVFSLLVLLPALTRPGGIARLHSRFIGLHLLRGLLGVAALGLFVQALRSMHLSDVVAIAYTAPLFVILWSRLLFHEAITWSSLIALLLGLLGGAIILMPSLDLLHWQALLPLGGAVLLSLYIALIKRMPADEAIAGVFYVTLVGILAAGAVAIWQWQAVPPRHWLTFALIGLLAGLALYCRNIGYARAPLTATVPIEYSGILWAMAFGFIWFGEQPALNVLPGSLLLLVSNLLLIRQSRKSDITG